MGVKIFRDNNWSRILCGIVSGGDILRLDAERDEELIKFLLLRLPEHKRGIAMRKYNIEELPEPYVNIDDPGDEYYEQHIVLYEQVKLEDSDVLREAAFNDQNYEVRAFAFCRLTGYSWPPDECDAYSYRTCECGLAPDMSRMDIEDFCREMIERQGSFAAEAKEWIVRLPDISDEILENWRKS